MRPSANNITALRDRLFSILDALQDTDNPMDIDRAKACTDTAQVIINSAKTEIEYLRVTGGRGSGFIPEAESQHSHQPEQPQLPRGTHSPAPGVLVHRIGDR